MSSGHARKEEQHRRKRKWSHYWSIWISSLSFWVWVVLGQWDCFVFQFINIKFGVFSPEQASNSSPRSALLTPEKRSTYHWHTCSELFPVVSTHGDKSPMWRDWKGGDDNPPRGRAGFLRLLERLMEGISVNACVLCLCIILHTCRCVTKSVFAPESLCSDDPCVHTCLNTL